MQVGRVQTLVVVEQVRGGFSLDEADPVFLPRRNAPDDLEVGASLRVFVFTDRAGEPIATTDLPVVQVGGLAALEVVDVAEHGAYLDWGLDRDLFVPHGLMHRPLHVGDRTVVAVDIDEHGRIFGSTKLLGFLDVAPPDLASGTEVSLLVYGRNEVGHLMVVEGRYTGLAYHSATFEPLHIGDRRTGWVEAVRPDGRIDVALQRGRREGTEDASAIVWEALEDDGSFLALHDRSSPAEIQARLQMSKKRFKKAVGALYRARRITLEATGIRAVDPE